MTIIETTLNDSLRALKLSGMLQTLDARLLQARAGEFGHLEFLQAVERASMRCPKNRHGIEYRVLPTLA